MNETTGRKKKAWFWVGVALLALVWLIFIPATLAQPNMVIIVLLIALTAVCVWIIIYGLLRSKEKQMTCTNCGYVGRPRRMTKGSFIYEIILWLMFALPGLIYTIWRVSTRYDICPKCKNPSMISVDTPLGQEVFSKQQKSPEHDD